MQKRVIHLESKGSRTALCNGSYTKVLIGTFDKSKVTCANCIKLAGIKRKNKKAPIN